MSSRLTSSPLSAYRSPRHPSPPSTPTKAKSPRLPFPKVTPRMAITGLFLLGLTLILHNYIKVVYQKELKTHAVLSLELNKWIQEEQTLRTHLQKLQTYQENHPFANLEEQPSFKQQWKKVKLLHIPIVTIEEKTAEPETLELSEHLTFTSPEVSNP